MMGKRHHVGSAGQPYVAPWLRGAAPTVAEPSFPVGTVVRLKSGGPKLTVSSQHDSRGLICVEWFDGGECRRDRFDPEQIVEVTADTETAAPRFDPFSPPSGQWSGWWPT